MKDATATMGMLLPDDVGGRDAVYVATIAVTAGAYLTAGRPVALMQTEREPIAFAAKDGDEPFLSREITTGDRFWLFLMPRTITSLRHQWTHPAFADAKAGETYAPPSAKLASEQWLRNFCELPGKPDYEDTMALAARRADGFDEYSDEEYLLVRGSDAHGDIPPEFWDHVAIVLGREIRGRRARFFSCSC